jgi:hypothetical protein
MFGSHCVYNQEHLSSAASVNVAVNPVEQLSLTVGAPTAASICAWVGLQGIAPIVPSVNVGGVRSLE